MGSFALQSLRNLRRLLQFPPPSRHDRFLISDNSVTESSYALTELAFAQKKWPHPAEVVIPVMVRRTGYERIPNYLKAVTVLEPRGNVAAEIADEVAKLAGKTTHRARIAQALSRHWQAPVVLGVAALVLAIAFLGEGRIGDGDGSRDQVARELEEMKAKLRSMEAELAMIKADYQALKVSFSQLQQGQKEELGAELELELALRLRDLSDEPSVVVPSYWAEIEAVTQDPLLSSAEKGDRMVDLITAALHDLDAEIEGQAQRLDFGVTIGVDRRGDHEAEASDRPAKPDVRHAPADHRRVPSDRERDHHLMGR